VIDGKVSIGKATSAYHLDVSGNVNVSGAVSTNGLTATGGITANAAQAITFGTNAPTMSGANIGAGTIPISAVGGGYVNLSTAQDISGAKTFTISLSRGIINKLDDPELEAVIAHELTHIRNRDVRLLIISIVFVGIFAFISEALFRSLRFGGMGRGGGKKGNAGAAILIGLVLALVGYLIASLFRFALSKKREYMADAGSVEMTKNPLALASALEKISQDSRIEAVNRMDVAQLFIDNPKAKEKINSSFSFSSIFATHPPIERRIELLKQF
jgi:Zn-dependent protease with chaperone function